MNFYRGCFKVVAIVFILSLINGCAREEYIIARFGTKETVTFEDLKEDYNQKNRNKFNEADTAAIIQHFNSMIEDKIKIKAAYEQGLDTDSSVTFKVENETKRYLVQAFREKEIDSQFIKEEDIRHYYLHMNEERQIRKIEFNFPPNPDSTSIEKVKNQAQQVLDNLKAGASFNRLARNLSKNPNTAEKSVSTETVEWKRPNDPIQKTAFSLKEGEISDLVKSTKGFMIIRVDSITKREKPAFSEARDYILNRLRINKRSDIVNTANAYWNGLKRSNQIQIHQERVDSLASIIRDIGTNNKRVLIDQLDQLSAEEKAMVLIETNKGSIAIQDFIEHIDRLYPADFRNEFGDPMMLQRFFEFSWLVYDFISEEAIKKGYDKDKNVQSMRKRYLESMMINALNQKIVDKNYEPKDEELQSYYETHKMDKYATDEKVKIQEVMVHDKKLAQNIYSWAIAGDDFDMLAENHTKRVGKKEKKGVWDYFTERQNRQLFNEAISLEPGQISNPIDLGKNQYAVIKLLDKVAPEPRPFEDVKRRVRRDMITQNREEKKQAWMENAKKHFDVRVYKEVLRNALEK